MRTSHSSSLGQKWGGESIGRWYRPAPSQSVQRKEVENPSPRSNGRSLVRFTSNKRLESPDPHRSFDREPGGHFHQLGQRSCFHLLHHLASVCLHRDLTDAEFSTHLLIQ